MQNENGALIEHLNNLLSVIHRMSRTAENQGNKTTNVIFRTWM